MFSLLRRSHLDSGTVGGTVTGLHSQKQKNQRTYRGNIYTSALNRAQAIFYRVYLSRNVWFDVSTVMQSQMHAGAFSQFSSDLREEEEKQLLSL